LPALAACKLQYGDVVLFAAHLIGQYDNFAVLLHVLQQYGGDVVALKTATAMQQCGSSVVLLPRLFDVHCYTSLHGLMMLHLHVCQ